MTVSSTNNRVSYSGNNSLTTFAYTFKIFDENDLTVILRNRGITATETVQTIVTDYTVTGVGDAAGGNVVFVTAPSNIEDVIILRNQPRTQGFDLVPNDPFPAQSLEESLDKLTFMMQQVDEVLDRAITYPRSTTVTSAELPTTSLYGKLLGFDSATGEPVAGPELSSVDTLSAISADIATLADIEDGSVATDAISDLAAIQANLITVAGSVESGYVQTVATNSADVQVVSTYITDVSTVAGIASDVTSVATVSSDIPTVAGGISSINTIIPEIPDINSLAYVEDGTLATNGLSNLANNLAALLAVNSDLTEINTVSGISSDVTTVAGISSDVTSVSTNNANVTTVAGSITNVNTAATNIADINTTATNIADVNTVAAEIGVGQDVTVTAANIADINTVSGSITNVNTAATNISVINTVATAISDVSTVSGDIAAVITAANDLNEAVSEIDTVANAITNVDLVGGSITNVNTVAGSISNVNTVATNITNVNDFFDVYRVGTTDPTTSLDAGDLFYNTSTGDLKIYNGTAWEQGVTAGSGFLSLTGGTMTGAITFDAAQTFDGRDLSVDGAKLDGIEASADVTDTANVTAAGALMDSELTSEASVKALDQGVATTDSPTFAGLTTTADVSLDANNYINWNDGSTDAAYIRYYNDTTTSNADRLDFYHSSTSSGTAGYVQFYANGTSRVIIDADETWNTERYTTDVGYRISAYRAAAGIPAPTVYLDITQTTFDAPDNFKILLGTGDDLELYHDATNSIINNKTGDLQIQTSGSTKLTVDSTGIDVTGNVTVSGTVDGRDIATDGTKLDGIESGATADQTASEILTAIKTVDGAGSGLDADLWDGNEFSSYLDQAVLTTSSPTFAALTITNQLEMSNSLDMNNYDIYGVDQIFHHGDTNTYIQFHAADQFRVVSGGSERLEVTNSRTQIDNLLVTGGLYEDYDALSGTTPSVDVDAASAFSLTMTGNTTFTFSGAAIGASAAGFVIELTGNGSTVTWPSSVKWAGGTAPDAPASGETDLYVFYTRDGGTNWYGALSVDAAA